MKIYISHSILVHLFESFMMDNVQRNSNTSITNQALFNSCIYKVNINLAFGYVIIIIIGKQAKFISQFALYNSNHRPTSLFCKRDTGDDSILDKRATSRLLPLRITYASSACNGLKARLLRTPKDQPI